jgi:hypothetical protein
MKPKLYQNACETKTLFVEQITLPEKTDFAKPACAKLAKTFARRNEADLGNLTLPKLDFARKKNLRQTDLTERNAE